MSVMNELKMMGEQVDMPAPREGPTDNRAGWWAMYLLALGERGDYDKLIEYLTIAQANGCLHVIRQAAEYIVKSKRVATVRPIKKTRARRSGTFKAVA